MNASAPVLVLGIGNELFTDEGIGPTAARLVHTLALPGVEALDGATLGLSLLPAIAGRRALLIIDAIVADGAEPGDLVRLDRDDIGRPSTRLLSAHQIGIGETLATAEFAGVLPSRVAAIGLVPSSLDTGVGLSEAVRHRLPQLLAAAVDILAGWDVPLEVC